MKFIKFLSFFSSFLLLIFIFLPQEPFNIVTLHSPHEHLQHARSEVQHFCHLQQQQSSQLTSLPLLPLLTAQLLLRDSSLIYNCAKNVINKQIIKERARRARKLFVSLSHTHEVPKGGAVGVNGGGRTVCVCEETA